MAKLKERIAILESEAPSARGVRREKDDRREHELEEKNEHLKWLNSSLKDENEKLRDKLEMISNEKALQSLKSAKNNDKWRNVALQEQVAVLTQRVIELEEEAVGQRRISSSPRTSSILQSPVMRSSLENSEGKSTLRSTSILRSTLKVPSNDDINPANHDLLSSSFDEQSNQHANAPQSIPNRNNTSRPSERSKGSRSSKIGFGLMKKSSKDRLSPRSPKLDDASNSTTNYNF